MSAAPLDHALSVRQLARRWAVGARKIREMIRRRLLCVFDVGLGGRRQLRITPEAVAECERRLAVSPAPSRRRRTSEIDPAVAVLLAEGVT